MNIKDRQAIFDAFEKPDANDRIVTCDGVFVSCDDDTAFCGSPAEAHAFVGAVRAKVLAVLAEVIDNLPDGDS